MSVRGLVLEAPRHLVEHRFPVPEIGEADGLLRVEACGLCGTDHEQYCGVLGGGFAFIPGHEVVGDRTGGRGPVGGSPRRSRRGRGSAVLP